MTAIRDAPALHPMCVCLLTHRWGSRSVGLRNWLRKAGAPAYATIDARNTRISFQAWSNGRRTHPMSGTGIVFPSAVSHT